MLYALLTAFLESGKHVLSKAGLKGGADEYIIALGHHFFGLPVLFVIALIGLATWHIPHEWPFWFALVAGGSLNTVAAILFVRSIKLSPLSECMPMLAFSPVFMLVTSPIIVGEFPTAVGLLGVLLTVLGAYFVFMEQTDKGILNTFSAGLRSPGARAMLGVAAIWAVASNIDKIGVLNSSPFVWVVATEIFLSCTLAFVAYWRGYRLANVTVHIRALFPLGTMNAFTALAQMTAVAMTDVVYVIAVKRTSVFLSSLWGMLFFGETWSTIRLAGSIIMVSGAALIMASIYWHI